MIYQGPQDTEFLLQILGLVLFRAGGYQTFTAEEINEINNFAGRIQVVTTVMVVGALKEPQDVVVVRLTSKGKGGGHEDSPDKQSYIAPNDPGASKGNSSTGGGKQTP